MLKPLVQKFHHISVLLEGIAEKQVPLMLKPIIGWYMFKMANNPRITYRYCLVYNQPKNSPLRFGSWGFPRIKDLRAVSFPCNYSLD